MNANVWNLRERNKVMSARNKSSGYGPVFCSSQLTAHSSRLIACTVTS